MHQAERPRIELIKRILGIILVFLPIFLFYKKLLVNVVNIPYQDDYYAVLHFLSTYSLFNPKDKLIYCLTAQHTDYKLIFEHFVFAALYGITGRINFFVLTLLGSLFVLFIFLLVLRMSVSSWKEIPSKLLLLAPCAYLLFQLQYVSALSWAMASWQILPAVFFSLLSIWMLCKDTKSSFWSACFLFFLAIASSGNGFFVFPVGLFLLGLNRQFRRMLVWCLVLAASSALYLWRYNFDVLRQASEPVAHSSHSFGPFYALSFLGASAARTETYSVSILLGSLLCVIFLYACRKQYYREYPGIFSSMLLLLVTAVGVSMLRGDLGIVQSLASRYRIYSNLFLLLVYLFLTHIVSSSAISRIWKQVAFGCAMVFTMAFALLSDRAGERFLQIRRIELINGLLTWQDPSFTPPLTGQVGEFGRVLERHREANIFRPDDEVLQTAIRLRIYLPPVCSSDGRCKPDTIR